MSQDPPKSDQGGVSKPPNNPPRAVQEFLNQYPSSVAGAPPPTSNGTADDHDLQDHGIAPDAEEEDIDDAELAELLKALDEANGVASGLEGRLDGILEDLETQLVRLEGEGVNGPGSSAEVGATASGSSTKPGSERPGSDT